MTEVVECGACTEVVPETFRTVKRVEVAAPGGAKISIQELGARCRTDKSIAARPDDVWATLKRLEQRPGGTRVAYKALPGYVFTVVAEDMPVEVPRRFNGTEAQARKAGWTQKEFGWCCRRCTKKAHETEDASSGTGGLVAFFEETKDK